MKQLREMAQRIKEKKRYLEMIQNEKTWVSREIID